MAPKQNEKVKRPHKAMTLQFKLKLIKLSEGGMGRNEISRKLGLPPSTVGTVLKNKQKVLNEIKNATPVHTKLIRKRDSLVGDMERLLLIWVHDQIKNNVPLSENIIEVKALSLFNALKAEKADSSEENFKASHGWFARFKNRANLHNIKVQGEAASADTEVAKRYPDELQMVIEEGGYTKQQIFNVDETALYWKKMPSRTFIAKEEKTMPGFKVAKDRITLLLGANAAGDFKLKPMLIHHSQNPRALKNYSRDSLPVYYKANSKAWMTGQLFTDWFIEYFKPAVQAYCKEKNIPYKILLLVDNAPSHPAALINMFKEIRFEFLPANTTSLIQPMDQGLISTFKSYYLRHTFSKAIEALDSDLSDCSKRDKLKFFWKGFNILDAIKIIKYAWDEVKQSTLEGVWKKLIPNLVDDFEGFDNVTENVVEMALELGLEVGPEDVHELLESHDEELTNEELLIMDEQRRLLIEQEGDEPAPEPKAMTTKELEHAIAIFDKGMSYLEEIDPILERALKVNAGVEALISCYKEILHEKKRSAMRQTKLTSYFTEQIPTPHSLSEPSTSTTTNSPLTNRIEICSISDDDD